MSMVKKSISVTDKQDEWIKAQIASGHFGNESEVVRELIRERQLREEETPEHIEAIREALLKGEQSGVSKKSVDEIWAQAEHGVRPVVAKYRLSRLAEDDLAGIAEYGDEYFGIVQSDRYREQLKLRFTLIAEQPYLYQAVHDIREGYRRSIFGRHSIYYRIDEQGVEIMRVLGRQDPEKKFARVTGIILDGQYVAHFGLGACNYGDRLPYADDDYRAETDSIHHESSTAN